MKLILLVIVAIFHIAHTEIARSSRKISLPRRNNTSYSNIIIGGVGSVNLSDPHLMKNAWYSVATVNYAHDGSYYLVPVKVISATSQVVSGVLYNMATLFAESTCNQEVEIYDVTPEKCPVRDGGRRYVFEMEVWEKAGAKEYRITLNGKREVKVDEVL